MLKPVLGSQIQLGHPLARGLVGLWLMNEGSGNVVQDLSGNGNTGTATSGVSWTGGPFGSVLNFPGAVDYVEIADSPILRPGTGDYTIGVWLEVPFSGDTWAGIYSKGMYTSAVANTWGLLREGTSTTRVAYQQATDGGGAFGCNISSGVMADGWRFILARRIGTTTQLYVDAILIAQDTSAGDNLSITSSVAIASDTVVRKICFDGNISHAFQYNRALSVSEIALLYQNPFAMFERDPIELWVGTTSVGAPPAGNAGIMITWGGYWGATY